MENKEDVRISFDGINEEDIPDKIPTKFINSRVIIFNPLYASFLYIKKRFFGSPLGINKPRLEYFSKPSELSLIEAYYPLENDLITIFDVKENKFLNTKEFFKIAKRIHHRRCITIIAIMFESVKSMAVISSLKMSCIFSNTRILVATTVIIRLNIDTWLPPSSGNLKASREGYSLTCNLISNFIVCNDLDILIKLFHR